MRRPSFFIARAVPNPNAKLATAVISKLKSKIKLLFIHLPAVVERSLVTYHGWR